MASRLALLYFGVLLILSTNVQAVPVYYTFEGSIGLFHDEETQQVAASHGFFVGTNVSYQVMVDLDQDAEYTLSASNPYPYVDYYDTDTVDYFYADLVGGTNFPLVQNRYDEVNMGVRVDGGHSALLVGNYLSIRDGSTDFIDWEIGDLIPFTNFFSITDGILDRTYFMGTVRLSSICDTLNCETVSRSVPEPGPFVLLSLGIAGLLLIQRKRNQSEE